MRWDPFISTYVNVQDATKHLKPPSLCVYVQSISVRTAAIMKIETIINESRRKLRGRTFPGCDWFWAWTPTATLLAHACLRHNDSFIIKIKDQRTLGRHCGGAEGFCCHILNNWGRGAEIQVRHTLTHSHTLHTVYGRTKAQQRQLIYMEWNVIHCYVTECQNEWTEFNNASFVWIISRGNRTLKWDFFSSHNESLSWIISWVTCRMNYLYEKWRRKQHLCY